MNFNYTNTPEIFEDIHYELPPELIDFLDASKALKISINDLLKLVDDDPDFPQTTMLTIPVIQSAELSKYLRLVKRKKKRQEKAAKKRKGGNRYGR